MALDYTDDPRGCFDVIQQYLIAGALGLLRRWDQRFLWSPGGAESTTACKVMAGIEFGGDAVRGGLHLLASHELVASMCPRSSSLDRDIGRELFGDTLGELANLLVGRVTRRLVGHKLETVISTPTCVVADALVLPCVQGEMVAWHTFRAGDTHTLLVRCTASFEAGFELIVGSGEQPVLREGEVMMFDSAERRR